MRVRYVLVGAIAAAAGVTGPSSAQESIDLTIASGYPPIILALRGVDDVFIPTVDEILAEEGTYQINWNRAYAGTLASATGTLDAVEAGLADIGHVVTVIESARLPLQNVSYYAPFGTEDPALASEIVHRINAEIPEASAEWDAAGVVYLGNYPLDTYQLLSSEPVDSIDDLAGLKVGGGGANLAWLEDTGAAPVGTTGARAYNDLNSGLIDAVLAPVSLARTADLHELAPYITDINFGAVSVGALVANEGRFDSLPQEVQEALLAGGEAYREFMGPAVREDYESAVEDVVADGAEFIELSDEAREEWASRMVNPATDWLEVPGAPAVLDLYMTALEAEGVGFPRDWRTE